MVTQNNEDPKKQEIDERTVRNIATRWVGIVHESSPHRFNPVDYEHQVKEALQEDWTLETIAAKTHKWLEENPGRTPPSLTKMLRS